MSRYRIDSIGELARQMGFTPHEKRWKQLACAEELLLELDPGKGYPLDYVIFRITGFRKRRLKSELLTGLALQHDLGLLIEQVSAKMRVRVDELAEPVLELDDLTARFNVTTKTIQRWRKRGLPSRRLIFPDGRSRVGFLLGSVEKFIAQQSGGLTGSANVSEMHEAEQELILRHARRLVAAGCGEEELCERIARRVRRSALTILHTLRKHDRESPLDAVLPASGPDPEIVAKVEELLEQGATLSEVAHATGQRRGAIYRAMFRRRSQRLFGREMRFIDDPLFHQPDAERVISDLLTSSQNELPPTAGQDTRVPRDLPPYLSELYGTPLLTPAKERALFLRYNFLRFQFVRARRALDIEVARNRELRRLEELLGQITEAKNAIIRANLRLVVSVARKHVRAELPLMDLVSEGNLTLMRAVEGFDISRGYRFSTYATFALMKGYARSVPRSLSRRSAGIPVESVPDRDDRAPSIESREQLRRMLDLLDTRERRVLVARWGVSVEDGVGGVEQSYDALGDELGISRQRVRQIERGALCKLRAAYGTG